jgi:hypothetical protein
MIKNKNIHTVCTTHSVETREWGHLDLMVHFKEKEHTVCTIHSEETREGDHFCVPCKKRITINCMCQTLQYVETREWDQLGLMVHYTE